MKLFNNANKKASFPALFNFYFVSIHSHKADHPLGHQLADGSFFFKTFITYEMSKGEQVDTFAKSEENRMQGHENLLKELGL